MANASMGLDEWRDYFRTSNSNIFSVIEHAMLVAASDWPYEFRLKRDRMAEILFTCRVSKCYGCDEKWKNGAADVAGVSKESKGSRSRDDCHGDTREVMEMDLNNNDNNININSDNNINNKKNNNNGNGEGAEALTDEIEQESLFHEEVLRIREIVDNSKEESDGVLFDSLRRLQLMSLSVETLKTTDIGRSVNALRKHGSKEIRNLVRTLIDNWKILVEEWVNATAIAGAEATPESVKTSIVKKVEKEEEEEEEEGLPSPPLDEGAFFTAPVSMELSQFFDGMDDDGNPQKCGEFNKNRENGRRQKPEKKDVVPKQDFVTPLNGHPKGELRRNQEPILRRQAPPSKPAGRSPVGEREPVRPKPKLVGQLKVKNEVMVQRKSDKGTIQKKPKMPQQQEKFNDHEVSVRAKLEAAKRKLQERYQEADNAKKQRTIQVVEPRDLPKPSLVRRNHHTRPENHQRHRQWANGRR